MANFDAPFVMMRRAPMIGRPESVPRVTVSGRYYSIDAALKDAAADRAMHDRYAVRSDHWLIRRGVPAHRSSRAR